MRNLIFKYNLTDQQWCDNRTIKEMEEECFDPNVPSLSAMDIFMKCHTLVSGDVVQSGNSLYALTKEAIEEYLKEQK